MIRRTVVVLDTPTNDHIHLFSVFEDILPDMQDANCRDRHTRANHYKVDSGQGDIQVHIENLRDVSISDVEADFYDYLVANGNELKRCNDSYAKEPVGDGESMILDAGTESRSTLKKVLPHRQGIRNVRTYIDAEKKTLEFVKQDEKTVKHIGEVTENVLGFNLSYYSEHIGNIYFVESASPIKDIIVSGISDPVGLLCSIEYRDSDWQESFTIQIRDRHHSDIIVWDKIYDMAGGTRLAILNMPQMPKEVEVYAYDKNHKLIFYHPYTPFVRSIHFEMGVQSKVLRVKSKNRDGEEVVTDYPKFTHEKPVIVKENGKTYLDDIFYEAQPLPTMETDDAGLRFRFFDADASHQEEYVEKARQVLQTIIDLARTECYICDPYFNANDFQKFILPLKSLNVNVKILNGKKQMEKKREDDKKETDHIKELKDVLIQYNEKVLGQPIQCKMLTGRGQLHDRFIIIDDRGWVLGASFSEFGNRVTTINEIPSLYFERIKRHISNWWYDIAATMNIEDYGNNNDTRNDIDGSTDNTDNAN